jgi:nucleoside 2-deoxyribosyltransferase
MNTHNQIIINPPHPIDVPGRKIFLAGSIEMGVAERWQEKAEKLLADTDWVILNPRRNEWDASWLQEKENPQFNEQVTWELDAQEAADVIVMYFDPATKSPISLFELGMFAKTGKMIVICPKGFWRKGNVDIICEKYGVTQTDSLEKAMDIVKAKK